MKIGELEVYITNVDEITFGRAIMFQNYFALIVNNINLASLQIFYEQFSKLQDQQLYFKAGNLVHDFVTSCNLSKEVHENTWGLAFACICNENNEDTTKYNEEFLGRKIKKYIDNGLKMADVKREVENFTKSSDTLLYSSYLSKKMMQ